MCASSHLIKLIAWQTVLAAAVFAQAPAAAPKAAAPRPAAAKTAAPAPKPASPVDKVIGMKAGLGEDLIIKAIVGTT
jgi:hypothetical protein